MAEQSPLIQAKNLTCIREDRILFEHLSFAISPGDIVQVEGPNGAGKTSLLRLLAGLSMPFEGNIFYQEQSIHEQAEHYYQDLLYLGHMPGVKAELTAQENLAFNLAMVGADPELAEDTLANVNLLGFEDATASHLSAGQHRRIALARLWQSQAKVWILDEPFTAIDKQGVASLEQLFVQHAQAGGCVILTTHQDLSLPADLVKKITLSYRFY
ncbi:cytochrome c biogenesis heme-transporting ATPase CcmA [Thalassotalea sp. M1531]|uniref:Cytochrome c biogenesis heme-transporting ATPase CcmA n=1 Tax=Thalassotalea algicola TaxID=2716224 RepID=A0A7Y0L9D6_9GAMM|nr:cytochrome c biogenesis heme-transporting ATPase CcmA [Thalassotalea algicola]NMP30266.1 cytochrome c biogenesis heme-transporting ATPase CcmA [Thalassotalea algicola]